jgi:uncharacterized protein GlcG (DUF336 family)
VLDRGWSINFKIGRNLSDRGSKLRRGIPRTTYAHSGEHFMSSKIIYGSISVALALSSSAHALPIVMLRGDGAGLHTPEGADRKAYTARTFRAPSADFVKRMQNDPTSVGSIQYTRVLSLPGGLPIRVGDDLVGAVGVSRSPGKDDDCSQAGIDKVTADLK